MNNTKKVLNKSKLDTYNISYNTPMLFIKKNKQVILKNITHIKSDTGETKHFTPATQE
jgi:hypothetical protein